MITRYDIQRLEDLDKEDNLECRSRQSYQSINLLEEKNETYIKVTVYKYELEVVCDETRRVI